MRIFYEEQFEEHYYQTKKEKEIKNILQKNIFYYIIPLYNKREKQRRINKWKKTKKKKRLKLIYGHFMY